jgi:phosphohistidine phosphatase SixA
MQAPDLIAHTTYLRTKETATPLIEKYPHIPVEILPVHEFNYQGAHAYVGTTVEERRERTQKYWNKNDPYYNDGE